MRIILLCLMLSGVGIVLFGCVSEQKQAPQSEQFKLDVAAIKAKYASGHNVDPTTGKPVNPLDTSIAAEPLKKLSIPKVGASESPRNDEIHDTVNDAIAILQDPSKAMHDFPRDRRDQVDWVQALEQGFIEPRANLKGDLDMITMDLDIVMKNTQFMPWVRFPHLAHTKWLHCSNCHPAIFIPQEHANAISMNKVLRGKYCGVCHDKVAFAIFICERCHSVPHAGSGPKWW